MSRGRRRSQEPVVAEPVDSCCGAPGSVDRDGEHEAPGRVPPWWRDRALALPIASGLLWLTGLALQWAGLTGLALGAHVVGMTAGARNFVPAALKRLLTARGRERLGVGLLMTLAAVGAVLLGHVGEAAALAFLFSIAETLEDRAMDRARRGLRALLSLIPQTARVSRLDGERVIPAAEVHALDVLIVGAGERVATDGVVVSGRSWMNSAAITGESIPVEVGPGDEVPAGAVNGPGALRIKATAEGRDNSLTQIVRLVEQAHASKGERARLADRIARPLVPLVLAAAVLIAAAGCLMGDPSTWIERALVVLVAASPCALAIAVPVTVISAIGSASRLGVIIKSGSAFEQLGTIRRVVFDKTGTLTLNSPRVVAVHAADHCAEAHVLGLAAALEAASSHPLADAVVAAAATRLEAAEVREDSGRGLTGAVDGRRVRVGSPRWIHPQALAGRAADMAGQGMTVTVVEADDQVVGVIGIRDDLRPEAVETISALHARGISTMMLTGDNTHTADAVAALAGIGEVHAEQLPADKAERVRCAAEREPTAMIGDGVNDAPALASATVGIAMGATGSAAAVESADIAFTGTDLRLIPDVLAHARRGRAIMTGNIGLALALITILFPLALLGVLGLAAVVLVHEVAEVVVILNGLRAARVSRRGPDLSRLGASDRSRRGSNRSRPGGGPRPADETGARASRSPRSGLRLVGEQVADLGEQLDVGRLGGLVLFLLAHALPELVHRHNDAEVDGDSDQEEVHYGGQDRAGLDVVSGRLEDLELADGVEVRLADDLADDVQDDFGDRVDDRLECGTDNDGDGELQGVALRDEP